MKKAGANIDWIDEQVWRYIAIPRLREAPSIGRMEQFMRTTRPPAFPFHADEVLVKRGAAAFAENCSECHGKDGKRTLTIIPLAEIGTD